MANKLYFVRFLSIGILLTFLFSCQKDHKDQIPYDLEIAEGFTNPIGFYTNNPTFSWKLPTGVQSQSAYYIVVASSPELLPDEADLWKSGKVETDQCLFVNYTGKKLSSRDKVYWQVKFWDDNENESKWSEIAFFEVGLLNNNDWQAKWISLPNDTALEVPEIGKKVHKVQYLRKSIKIQDDIESARLYITALGLFQAHINGQQIGDDVLLQDGLPIQNVLRP